MFKSIMLAVLVGGFTGIIGHLVRNDKVLVFPRRRIQPRGIELGFIADMLLGSAAAVFAVTYLASVVPIDNIRAIIGISILASMSAESVLMKRSLHLEKAKADKLDEVNRRLEDDIKKKLEENKKKR